MIKSAQRRAAGVLAGTVMAAGTTLLLAPPASALTADCTTVFQTQQKVGLDYHRAGAKCSSIGSGTKVRAKLIRNGAVDYTSAWFTTTGTWYYTGWATCYAGCSATYEVAAR